MFKLKIKTRKTMNGFFQAVLAISVMFKPLYMEVLLQDFGSTESI